MVAGVKIQMMIHFLEDKHQTLEQQIFLMIRKIRGEVALAKKRLREK